MFDCEYDSKCRFNSLSEILYFKYTYGSNFLFVVSVLFCYKKSDMLNQYFKNEMNYY